MNTRIKSVSKLLIDSGGPADALSPQFLNAFTCKPSRAVNVQKLISQVRCDIVIENLYLPCSNWSWPNQATKGLVAPLINNCMSSPDCVIRSNRDFRAESKGFKNIAPQKQLLQWISVFFKATASAFNHIQTKMYARFVKTFEFKFLKIGNQACIWCELISEFLRNSWRTTVP